MIAQFVRHREPRAARDVENARSRLDAGDVQQAREQRLVLRLGDLRPVARRRAPQFPLLGDHGATFWLSWNS